MKISTQALLNAIGCVLASTFFTLVLDNTKAGLALALIASAFIMTMLICRAIEEKKL